MKSTPILTLSLQTALLLIIISLTVQKEASAQSRGTGLGLIAAFHHGEEFSLEAGIGYGDWGNPTRYVDAQLGSGCGLSVETILVKDPVIGTRLGAWANVGVSLGLSLGYYTNSDQGTMVIQPEIGIGFAPGRLTWRATIPFASMPTGMSSSDLTASIFIKL